MSAKGIIFSAPMVRALLAGRKTQTRRLLCNPEFYGCPTGDCPHERQAECNAAMAALTPKEANGYAVGDRLYVREAWKTSARYDGTSPRDLAPDSPIYFVADDRLWPVARYRQGRHMPRWASRVWLEVSEVRVQRLHDISEEDARAEGLGPDPEDFYGMDPRGWYRDLWNTLHTKPGQRWDDNPWIVAVSIDVHHCNVDLADIIGSTAA